jgi:hypothetical protein
MSVENKVALRDELHSSVEYFNNSDTEKGLKLRKTLFSKFFVSRFYTAYNHARLSISIKSATEFLC